MSKLGKFKDILAIGSAVGKPFLPGAAGSILDAVNGHLSMGGASDASKASAQQLAADNDEQTAAIIRLHERQLQTEKDVAAIKQKLGI
jgi:hypothetical protein